MCLVLKLKCMQDTLTITKQGIFSCLYLSPSSNLLIQIVSLQAYVANMYFAFFIDNSLKFETQLTTPPVSVNTSP